MREYDDVLLAQEAAEDSRLQARASRMWRESQEYSCAEDNETTPWLQHTRWPERFRNRPLDIITASSRLPARGCYEQNEDFTLGSWRGIPLRSSAAVEARIRVLMRAVDDMFDRAEATLACTSYQSRCWLTSYRNGVFRNRPLRVMPSSTGRQYKSKWKRVICYIFRALELGPRRLREVHNMVLRGDDIKMMNHIVNLASHVVEREDVDDEDCEDDAENNAENDGDKSSDYSDCDSNYDSGSDSDCEGNGDGRVHDQSNIRFVDEDGEGEMRNNGEDTKDGHAPYHDASQYIFRLPHGTRLELSEAVFQLSMMFWTYQCQDGVMDSSAIVHFTAVMGIHRSSLAYRDAYSFTPDLAALIWVGRLLFLEYSLPRYSYDTLVYPWPARHTYSSQPERLEAIRKKYMLRGCYSPLSELIELKAFGKSIVRREGVRGTLTWAPDGRSFTIGDGKVVRLSEFLCNLSSCDHPSRRARHRDDVRVGSYS
ncbi:telomere-associated recQ-like helicase [Metarhizium guizhouense ARSEF 977]|uniref:Telomere-associated recQ-like helicase n=1 Tax=Metarhizium guizhouense (strain ARSEF 977) TaxID=1276136 RepID=A0A0B4GI30_METGA|nr:telomere-associated recQ-like helicase [Metarhizium guizhouense ARSEF 977]